MLNFQAPQEHSKEVGDCKQLIKTLVMGEYCKCSIFMTFLIKWDSKNENPSQPCCPVEVTEYLNVDFSFVAPAAVLS